MQLKSRLLLACIVFLIMVAYVFNNSFLSIKSNLNCNVQIKQDYLLNPVSENDTLFSIGMRTNTDKVTYHRYDIMYERYFKEYRNKNFTLLEIGLGCGTATVGASAMMWRIYFGPQAKIHVIEFDAACASNWSKVIGNKLNIVVHHGSQDNPIFLKEIIKRNDLQRFDIIIDDGGHTMNQQSVSLQTLISAVRPNGLYVIEDLETSYMPNFGGDPNGTANHTTTVFLKQMIDDLQDGKPGPKWNSNLMGYIYSFDIGPGIVFLRIRSDVP